MNEVRLLAYAQNVNLRNTSSHSLTPALFKMFVNLIIQAVKKRKRYRRTIASDTGKIAKEGKCIVNISSL